MLRSVVEQKRQAELDEALATSGWTASPNTESASTPPSTFLRLPSPRGAKEEELLARALTSVQ
jgi:hypothetical protein